MSEAQVAEIVKRASTEDAFSQELFNNFDEALKKNGYVLTPAEVAEVNARLSGASPAAAPGSPQGPPPPQSHGVLDRASALIKQQEAVIESRAQAQLIRANDLADYTVKIFKNTLNISASTYRTVTIMNMIMFGIGVVLFLFAAFYGVFTHSVAATATFGSLGAATFVVLFFLGPIKKTQSALSSLIQAEIAFMTYYEQIGMADTYAALHPAGSGQQSAEYIAVASEMLQKRSRETIELLQIYVGHDSPDLPSEQKDAIAKAASALEQIDAAKTAGSVAAGVATAEQAVAGSAAVGS
jgi:ABC-type multidrug transport system fused ATPase/permease subunit